MKSLFFVSFCAISTLVLTGCAENNDSGKGGIPLTGAQDAGSPEAIALMDFFWCGDERTTDGDVVESRYDYETNGSLTVSYFSLDGSGERDEQVAVIEGLWGLRGSDLVYELGAQRSNGEISFNYDEVCDVANNCRVVPTFMEFTDKDNGGTFQYRNCD